MAFKITIPNIYILCCFIQFKFFLLMFITRCYVIDAYFIEANRNTFISRTLGIFINFIIVLKLQNCL